VLLDLFCGAGGAAMGYHRAGFEVVGVDIRPQPHYPFAFHQADALTFPLDGFDAVHASPPCQRFSLMRRGLWQDRDHPDLIPPTRERLLALGLPYVIENVAGARSQLRDPWLMLCGTMFGLGVGGSQLRRHRYFEHNMGLLLAPPCTHNRAPTMPVYGGEHRDYNNPPRRPKTVGVWGHAGGLSVRDGLVQFGSAARREAMGIDWMTGDELSEAIPPAYTEWIGGHLLREMAA
jgi:DNA (cytosine-5)-methyltransferase 1